VITKATRATAVRLLLLVYAGAAAAAAMQAIYPAAEMSAYQREYMARLDRKATAASAAATARVLSAIGSPAFKEQLATCCPELVGLAAPKLLALIEAEVAVAEITHNFASPAADDGTGPNISGMAALSAVPNTWTSALMGDMATGPLSAGPWEFAGGLELGLFGMKPFSLPTPAWLDRQDPGSGVGWPASLAEARDRPVYGIWNLWKQAMPGRMYGAVATVLRNSVVQAGTFTAPMDSGAWIQVCNTTRNIDGYASLCSQADTAVACLCDYGSGMDPEREARCRSRSDHHLCAWRNGSRETVWQCRGGATAAAPYAACRNATVVTRPLPAGANSTAAGSCSLLPGLTAKSKDAQGQNIWDCSNFAGPGDQCGNCSAIPTGKNEAQGTLTSWHHTMIQSADYWADVTPDTNPNQPDNPRVFMNASAYSSLPSKLAAILGRSAHATKPHRPRITHGGDRDFFEADVVANVTYAAGVKFLLADMPAHFGTAAGAELQRWAAKNGWALVWSLGWAADGWGMYDFFGPVVTPGGWKTNPSDREDRRLLDLSYAGAIGNKVAANLTELNNSTPRFHAKWAAVAAVRRDLTLAGKQYPPPAVPRDWMGVWRDMLEDLPAAALVVPLSAASCADGDNCIGVTSDGDCVCYQA
jgi:hypothetical protein